MNPDWLTESQLTWYLLRRHQTLDRNLSKRGSSIQLYLYNNSWTTQTGRESDIHTQTISPLADVLAPTAIFMFVRTQTQTDRDTHNLPQKADRFTFY